MTYVLVVLFALHGGGEGVAIKRYDHKYECLKDQARAAELLFGKTVNQAECHLVYHPSPEEQVQGWLLISP
jgi:hypothetical protein